MGNVWRRQCGRLVWARGVEIAHNLWQLFNSTCLLPLQKKRKNRSMTQRKWVEVILQKPVARGIALALDELPRRYVSREFLTL